MKTALEQALALAHQAHESSRAQQRDHQVLHALTIRGVRLLLDSDRGGPVPSAKELLRAAEAEVEELRT